jgi:hypothetical protein
MNDHPQFSRPARLAATLSDCTEDEALQLFSEKHVLVRIEEEFASVPDARETFLFAVNQILRFCPNVVLHLPQLSFELIENINQLKEEIHESTGPIQVLALHAPLTTYDAILNIGSRIVPDLPWITINSSGWVARAATALANSDRLPWTAAPSNPCGALAAACFGAGLVFFTILGRQPALARELSLMTLIDSVPGSLDAGPALPNHSLNLDTFVIGCGAVTNGWAYCVKRLPIAGKIQAVDRQSLRIENVGPYVLARRSLLGTPKAVVIESYLAPTIAVTPRPEEWELFKIRLRYGLPVPAIIVNGLDNVLTRHSVQRLWPKTLIDMAAGGLTTQVIVNHAKTESICLLGALDVPPNEVDWADRLSQQSGLKAERIRQEPTSEITKADVAAAAPNLQRGLEGAEGTLICGRITHQNLNMEGHDPNFAPAVPFVTAFSGVIGAAETMKYLMGCSKPFHYQQNFLSYRGRALQMKCEHQCECQVARKH